MQTVRFGHTQSQGSRSLLREVEGTPSQCQSETWISTTPGWPHFGSGRLRFVHGAVRAVLFVVRIFCLEKVIPRRGARFWFLRTVLTVPVPLSVVPRKTVPMVPFSGSLPRHLATQREMSISWDGTLQIEIWGVWGGAWVGSC